MEEGILKKSINSGKWMSLGAVIQKLLGFVTFFILARFLLPADFGLMTIIGIVPGFLDLITSFNLETAVIQRKQDSSRYLNAIWTLNLIRALGIAVLMFFSGPMIASWFQSPDAALAIRLGGLLVLFQYLSNIGQVFFQKEIDFKKIFIRDIVSRFLYSLTAIVLAVTYRSVWALFIATLLLHLSAAVSTYILHPYRPRFSLRFKNAIKNLFGYGKWIFLQGVLSDAYQYAESAFLGFFFGTSSLGLYSRGKGLAYTPSGTILSIINKIAFPAYAKLQESPDKIHDGFLKSLRLVFFITIPFVFLMFIQGEQLILVFLGNSWKDMIIFLQLFSIGAVISVFSSLGAPLLNSLGKPKLQARFQLIHICTLFVLFVIFVRLGGIQGAVFALLVAEALLFLFYFHYFAKLFMFTIREFLAAIISPIIASLALIPISALISPKTTQAVFPFLIFLALFGGLYIFFIYLLEKIFGIGPYRTMVLVVRDKF